MGKETIGLEHHSVPDKHLPVGYGTHLNIEVEALECRLTVLVVGIVPDNYIILKIPHTTLIGEITSKFSVGTLVVVRYMFEGAILGFRSKVLTAISSPDELVFISYPKTVQDVNRRADQRFACTLPSNLKFDKIEIPGIILDINKSGCRFSANSFNLGKKLLLGGSDDGRVEIIVQFPGTESEESLQSNIVRVRQDGTTLELGIRFKKYNEETAALMGEFLGKLNF